MYYCIAKFEVIKPHEKKFTVIREMSSEEYELLEKNHETLTHFLFSNNYYKMLKANINELLNYILKIEKEENGNILIMDEKIMNINRLTINLLGIFFSYINHYENNLKKFKGKNSSQVEAFKKITAKYFDTHFEYRFLYKLRNYSIHCTIPITHIHSSIQEPIKKYCINTKSLLENFSQWGSLLTSELKKIDEINIKDLVEKSKVMFHNLHKELVLIDNFDIYTSLNVIDEHFPKDIKQPVILISNSIEDFKKSKFIPFDPFQTSNRVKYEINQLGILLQIVFDKDKGTAIFGDPFMFDS